MAVAIEHTRRDRESRRDPLTGLLNRREFDRLLREHAIRWRRQKRRGRDRICEALT